MNSIIVEFTITLTEKQRRGKTTIPFTITLIEKQRGKKPKIATMATSGAFVAAQNIETFPRTRHRRPGKKPTSNLDNGN